MDIISIQRKGTNSAMPHELRLITDEKDPMFDKRVLLPLSDEAILNQAAVGVVQALTVKVRGQEALVADGSQRCKRGLVINALNGSHPYRGALQVVKDAIERLRAPDSEVGKAIIGLCPAAVKVPIIIFRGDEAESYMAKTSANAIREIDAIDERARKARNLAQRFGKTNEEIGIALGCSSQTAARLLARDPDAKRAPNKKRGATTMPKAKIRKVLDAGTPELSAREHLLVRFAVEGMATVGFDKEFPKLFRALAAK